jgi:peptide/nickel transport system substrate-binding protein
MIKAAWKKRKLEVRIGASLAAVALVMMALLASSPPASSTTRAKAGGSSFLNIIADPAGPFADGFNPFSLSNSAYLQGATGMIYEPLMQYNLLKVGQIYPWLA